MKLTLTLLVASTLLSTATAFAPPAFYRAISITRVFSDPADEPMKDEELDLNLGDMFELFDAAEKEQKFDIALDKLKATKEQQQS